MLARVAREGERVGGHADVFRLGRARLTSFVANSVIVREQLEDLFGAVAHWLISREILGCCVNADKCKGYMDKRVH